jgi:hypothetical protein
LRRLRCARSGLGDVDASFEVGAIFNNDPAGFDVTHQLGFFLDVYLVSSINITLDGSVNDYLAGFETSLHARIRSDCEAVFLALNGALDFPIDCQIFSSEDLAFDGHVFA